jgi:hypothetical protein
MNGLLDVTALMELRGAMARYMMALLSWCEFGRSLAMPGLIYNTQFRKNRASTWEMSASFGPRKRQRR